MKRKRPMLLIKCQLHPETREHLRIDYMINGFVRVSCKGSIVIKLEKLIKELEDFKKTVIINRL